MAFMLDKQGLLLTVIIGIIVLVASDIRYIETILIFFIAALLITKYEYNAKKELGIYEHERSWENVLSNGLLPMLLAIASPFIGFIPYVSALAAITADKFASEIGVLGGNAISLETLKPVRPGQSGAVSILGTLASLAGGTLVGVSAIFIFNITPTNALIIGVVGAVGSLIDSIFGIWEEKGIGTKATTNFVCSMAGAILGYLIIK